MCSMISSQCDKLRETADELDERAKAYAPTGRNVLSPMLRSAADTIWELRCKLAGVVDQSDEIERLKAENTKLRELLAIASDMARDYDGDRRLLRRLVQELYEDQCDEHDRWKYRDRMHELGVKVDG